MLVADFAEDASPDDEYLDVIGDHRRSELHREMPHDGRDILLVTVQGEQSGRFKVDEQRLAVERAEAHEAWCGGKLAVAEVS